MALDDDMTTPQEKKNKKRGMVISTIIHVAVVLLALLPILTYPDPPPGQAGILVNLGLPDEGSGIENAGPSEPIAEAEPLPVEETPVQEVEEMEPEPEEVEPDPAPEPEVVETEDPEEVALKREAERRKRAEAEARKQEEEARRKAEAERKQREAEEARRKAEAEKFKDQIGGLFGDGKGKGETGKEGNQGDPGGDPDASKLDGISTGSGKVGGGLGNRGVMRAPKPEDSSQQTGTVVVEVCVDSKGNVISANFTQRGSTTTNAELVRISVDNARKWKFSEGEVDKQCGTITYSFKLR